jgi:starvation-inducible DNA-binding protein
VTTTMENNHRNVAGKIALDAEGLRQNLRMILAHLLDLHLLGSQACCHLAAVNSLPAMRLHLDSVVQTVREAIDTLIERLRALEADSHCASATTLPAPPLGERSTSAMLDRITYRIVTLADIIDGAHDRVEAVDSSTADLLRVITYAFEAHVDTLKSQNLGIPEMHQRIRKEHNAKR